MSPQLSAPGTVLISGQLQFSGWRLPVSVPFANFSSQGRHKTQGTPAAVHPNPVSSTSLDHTRGRQPASVWPWFGASVQEILTHGAKEPAGSVCFCSTYVWVSMHRFCETQLVCYSKNDATCFGLIHSNPQRGPIERILPCLCSLRFAATCEIVVKTWSLWLHESPSAFLLMKSFLNYGMRCCLNVLKLLLFWSTL